MTDPLHEHVREDPNRRPEEKETGFWIAGDSDDVQVTSYKASVVKRLLAHEEFEPSSITLYRGEDYKERTNAAAASKLVAKGFDVVGVVGDIPVRFLSIGTGGRSNDNHSGLVSGGVF